MFTYYAQHSGNTLIDLGTEATGYWNRLQLCIVYF